MDRGLITEILHQKMSEVNNTASLLSLTRYKAESDEVWRERVAYAMQAKLFKAEGRQLSDKIVQRMQEIEDRAKNNE